MLVNNLDFFCHLPLATLLDIYCSYYIIADIIHGASTNPDTMAKLHPPTREELKDLVHRKINGISAATKLTLEAQLQREIDRREDTQEQLEGTCRQNYILAGILEVYEKLIPELEEKNRVNEAQLRESREEIRKGKQREEDTEDYIRRLEEEYAELENASSRRIRGAARREEDLKLELNAENERALQLEHSLHLQNEDTRQIIELQTGNLRAQHAVNEFLRQYKADEADQALRVKSSLELLRRLTYQLRKASSTITHQGERLLAARALLKADAKKQTRKHRSIMTDFDVLMMDREDVLTPMDIDFFGEEDTVMDSPPPTAMWLELQDVEMMDCSWWDSPDVERIYSNGALQPDDDIEMTDCPIWPSNTFWSQHRIFPAGSGMDYSGSDGTHPFLLPPRKKRTRRHWNSGDDASSSPKRRKSLGETPERRPELQSLEVVDQSTETPAHQEPPIRLMRPRASRWDPFWRAITKNNRGTPEPSRVFVRHTDLLPPSINLLASTKERQRHSARGRSLSLSDLPQLPSAQTPGMWPSQGASDGEVELVSECERVWRAVVGWFLHLLREQPLLMTIGLIALLWLLHGQRAREDWMESNEIPFGVVTELRNRRVSETRWVESLVFDITEWLDIDRSWLG